MKYYKIEELEVKVECEKRTEIPYKLGYEDFEEIRESLGVEKLNIKKIDKAEYDKTDDYLERY